MHSKTFRSYKCTQVLGSIHVCNSLLLRIHALIYMYLWRQNDRVLGMVLKLLETTLLKKVCLASNRMVQTFSAGPNLNLKMAKLLFILHSENLRFLPWEFKRRRRNSTSPSYLLWNVDHRVILEMRHWQWRRGVGVESFEECKVFLNENP